MSDAPQSTGGPVRPLVAVAFATAGFVALLIFGLGMVSLLLDEDVIPAPDGGQLSGILGTTLATIAFAVALWAVVRAATATFWGALGTTLAAYLAYLAGVWLGATGSGPAAATSVMGSVAVSWFGLVVAAVGFVAGWAGIALVRTRAHRPEWPWEHDEDE